MNNIEAKEYLRNNPNNRVRLNPNITGPLFCVLYRFKNDIFESRIGSYPWKPAMHADSWINTEKVEFIIYIGEEKTV